MSLAPALFGSNPQNLRCHRGEVVQRSNHRDLQNAVSVLPARKVQPHCSGIPSGFAPHNIRDEEFRLQAGLDQVRHTPPPEDRSACGYSTAHKHRPARYSCTLCREALSQSRGWKPYRVGTFARLTLCDRQILPPYFRGLVGDWLSRKSATHEAESHAEHSRRVLQRLPEIQRFCRALQTHCGRRRGWHPTRLTQASNSRGGLSCRARQHRPHNGDLQTASRPSRCGSVLRPLDSFAVSALDRPRSRSSATLGTPQAAGAGCNAFQRGRAA